MSESVSRHRSADPVQHFGERITAVGTAGLTEHGARITTPQNKELKLTKRG